MLKKTLIGLFFLSAAFTTIFVLNQYTHNDQSTNQKLRDINLQKSTLSLHIHHEPARLQAEKAYQAILDYHAKVQAIKNIPPTFYLQNMSHEYQRFNNCGPTSLAMALSHKGINISQLQAADTVKGNYYDKNVSPQEMVNYLQTHNLQALYRVGGTKEIIQQLIANNIPVIVHQWMVDTKKSGDLIGHYRVVRGYNQENQTFITNDSYLGPNFTINYTNFDNWWRPFHYGYIPLYNNTEQETIQIILGQDFEASQNFTLGLQKAQLEFDHYQDNYAHFNLGFFYYHTQKYPKAVEHFNLGISLGFPKYYLWYHPTPMQAWLQNGDYSRLIDHANWLNAKTGGLEEAYFLRGQAHEALQNLNQAQQDYQQSLKLNPRYQPALQAQQ